MEELQCSILHRWGWVVAVLCLSRQLDAQNAMGLPKFVEFRGSALWAEQHPEISENQGRMQSPSLNNALISGRIFIVLK